MERGIDLSLLDTSAMSEKEQMQLAPFHQCYKAHERAYTWREYVRWVVNLYQWWNPRWSLSNGRQVFLSKAFTHS